MRNLISKLIADESAQDLAEYGIALAVVAVGTVVAVQAVGTSVNTIWTNAQSVIAGV
jgi:Flp pilus assembly pilin Flp